uniref:NADH-ubiquinone oxidoreductase chain 6 n=1 Tax=Bolitobius castaneus TaxID=877873 RepID=A0A0S2M6X8_9COLE|nr:NADH deshydrogenase subunit 6 [Bolitobius castaneus]
MIMMTFSMMMAMIFMFLNHPLSMGMILLLQTILIALMSGYLAMNFWYSYILFLIMIGGMLVLFIYMTSIASNEKFNFSNKMLISVISLIPLNCLFLYFDQYFINMMKLNLDSINFNFKFYFSLSKFINYPSLLILIMMILYLFITLIAVVKITNINSGPLRQKF